MNNKRNFMADFAEEITDGIQKTFHAISVRGERHQREDEFNQDYFCCAIHSQFAYIATADGLGSSPLSHIGAEKAVSLFKDIIVETIQQSDVFNEVEFPFLLHQVHEQWLSHFGEEAKQYDTTFQYIIVYQDVAVCGNIGDGLLMIASDEQLIFEKQNEALFSNQTNSFASDNSLGSLLMQVIPLPKVQKQPIIFILATDGISDDLKPELIAQLPTYLIKQRQTQTAFEMQNEIGQWIMNWQTSNHTDDRTFCFYLIGEVGEIK